MTTHDVVWDEDRNGPRTSNNFLSVPKEGMIHRAMKKVLPWQDSSHELGIRMVIPSVEIEQLMRKAPVKNPNLLGTLKLVERCLDTTNYLDGALDLLIAENWLKTEDDDGNTTCGR